MRVWSSARNRRPSDFTIGASSLGKEGRNGEHLSRTGNNRAWECGHGTGFSADGKTLVSGSYDKTVIIWDVATGMMRRVLPTKRNVDGLALTPDGSRLVVDDGQVWNTFTGQKVRSSRRYRAPLSYSPDGRTLACASFLPDTEEDSIPMPDICTILLTDTRTGRTLQQFPCSEDLPWVLAFSADGELVAAVNGCSEFIDPDTPYITTVCNLRTGEIRQVLKGLGVFLFGVNLGSGVRLVAASSDGSQLWNAETGEPLKTVANPDPDHRDEFQVCLSSNGQWLAVGTTKGVVSVWDVATAERLWQTEAHQDWIHTLVFTHDGETLATTAGEDPSIRLWHTRTGAHQRTLGISRVSVEAVAFSADGETITALSKDGTARLWRIHPPSCEHQEDNFPDLLAWWAPHKPDTARNLWRLPATLPSESELPAGFATISGMGRTIYTLLSSRPEPPGGFSINAVSPDGSLLLLRGLYGDTAIWNGNSRLLQCVLPEAQERGFAMPAFSPDNRLIAIASGDGNWIRLFDTQTGKIWRELAYDYKGMMAEINIDCNANAFTFSFDSRLLAVAHVGPLVTIWDVQTGKRKKLLWVRREGIYAGMPYQAIHTLAFSPDAKILAIVPYAEETVWLKHLTRGRRSLWLLGHTNYIHSVDFSPDGTRLATGAQDGTVRLWEVETGKMLATFLPLPETE